ncbi:MAG: cytochrome c maturation protein CcmE [Vicinamibacteria bacterium]|nr:cytochrome c maturation protein CcmE [Vicinamibacteria bacterium]
MRETQAAPPPAHTRPKKGLAIAAIAIAVTVYLGITIGGMGRNIIYYYGPQQLKAAGRKAVGAQIRLGGQVAPGSIVKRGGAALEFDVVDRRAKVHVVATGVPPQMFREGIGVVVEGTLTEQGYFRGNRLLVSHGNAYRAPDDHEQADPESLIRSTKDLEKKP